MEANIGNKGIDFERTVRAFSADLYRYAYWLCRDRFVAEELVQEMFARAWKSWAELRDPGSVKPWLIAILRNERARMFARKQIPIAVTLAARPMLMISSARNSHKSASPGWGRIFPI